MPNKIPNSLQVARLERGLSRKHVASILSSVLGYKGFSALKNYEQGNTTPPLKTALCLEIIYRRPVAYLFAELYQALHAQVRSREEELATQGGTESPGGEHV